MKYSELRLDEALFDFLRSDKNIANKHRLERDKKSIETRNAPVQLVNPINNNDYRTILASRKLEKAKKAEVAEKKMGPIEKEVRSALSHLGFVEPELSMLISKVPNIESLTTGEGTKLALKHLRI